MSSSSVDSSKPEFEGSVSGLSGRYASALFELMQEAPDTDHKDISNSMDVLSGLFGVDQSFGDMLVSPVISIEDKENALVEIFSKASIGQIVMNFAVLVVKNRRAFLLQDICRAFKALEAKARGETTAHVTTASKLSEQHENELKQQLKNKFGQDISVIAEVDQTLLAGMIVRVGSRMIDDSLRTKLFTLKHAMNEAG
ncbi:MAG: F0F1 ATP synthase subunit delta [Pseudomonadota bacterium]|nr:F0F1 ATP synthase subunit delta [Pseudomonadota bacterium]